MRNKKETRKIVADLQLLIKNEIQRSNFSIKDIETKTGYSRRQLDRLFKEQFNKTFSGYIKAVVISQAAQQLMKSNPIMNTALDYGFESQEGFTRAFKSSFGITPGLYQKYQYAIPLFLPYPADYIDRMEVNRMNSTYVKIYPVTQPKCKLIFLASENATDYLSFCQENGCEWEHVLNSIPEKMQTAAIITLPDSMKAEAKSNVVAGVCVPLSYSKPIPEGFKEIQFPEMEQLIFQSSSYTNKDEFNQYIMDVFSAFKSFNPEEIGYCYVSEGMPFFNYGASETMGAKISACIIKQ